MGCGSWDAAARRRWAKVARIGYALRQARRNRARVPHLVVRHVQSADTSDSLPVESKFQADAVGVDTAPAASKPSALLWVGRSLPPSRKQLEEWERRAAPALFDELTEDGNRSAVTAVRLREWRLEERQRQAWRVARTLDVDPTIRYRCPAWWSIMVCDLITYTFADFLPEFDVVLRRAWLAGDFDFSAVPLCGRWGWRRRARLAGYR